MNNAFEIQLDDVLVVLSRRQIREAIKDCEHGEFTPTLHAAIDAQLVAKGVLICRS